MFKKLTRFLCGLLLVPITLSTFYHLPSLISLLDSRWDSLLFLFSGAVLYIVFETLFSRPMRTYVFGHELTHALASLAMGGKVHSFHMSKKGGSVSLSKTNFFVALAPYSIPIYTFFILLIYFALRFWYPVHKIQIIFLGLIGFSLAFHLSLTIFAIRQEQPDIQKTGFFFSLIFILLVNSWVLILLITLLFWEVFSLREFFLKTIKTQMVIWKWVFEQGASVIRWSRVGQSY